MNMIRHKNSIYVINDIINIHGTYHLIISKDKDVEYINKIGDKYYIPRNDLSIEVNPEKTLEDIRKQHLLKMLIEYIKENDINSINNITEVFKEYVKTSLVETFLYWPYMTNSEFIEELKILKKDMYNYIDDKLNNHVLAPDNETIIIIDNYNVKSDFSDDDFIVDPSYKHK